MVYRDQVKAEGSGLMSYPEGPSTQKVDTSDFGKEDCSTGLGEIMVTKYLVDLGDVL